MLKVLWEGTDSTTAPASQAADGDTLYLLEVNGQLGAQSNAVLKLGTDVLNDVQGGKVTVQELETLLNDLAPFSTPQVAAVAQAAPALVGLLSSPGGGIWKYFQVAMMLASIFVH